MNIRNYPWDYEIAQICFKKKMNKLFNCPEYVRTYIDELLIMSNKSFEDHVNKLDKELINQNRKGLRYMKKRPFSPEMN